MRRKEKEITDKSEIESIITQIIGMQAGAGRRRFALILYPYVSAIKTIACIFILPKWAEKLKY